MKQALLDIVDECEGVVFGTSADVQGRDGFADGVHSQPHPASRSEAAHTSVEFIHLKHSESEIAEQAIVPELRMAAHAVDPAGDSGVGVASEADHDGPIDALCDKPEHHFDPCRIGFKIVERGTAARGEDLAASLTLETGNAVVMSVANKGMNGVVDDPAVVAVRIWAGKALG